MKTLQPYNSMILKCLTTILVLVFLSVTSNTPLKAQSSYGKWVEAKNKGCMFYNKPFPEFDYFYWSGGCADGYCHGQGTINARKSNGELAFTLEAKLVRGRAHGHVVQSNDSGDDYFIGNCIDNYANGFGKTFCRHGKVSYEGNWTADEKNGQGTSYYCNGDIKYKGEWKYGKKHGQGTYYWHNGEKYVGGWKDDEMNGRSEFFSEGQRYVGTWKDGEIVEAGSKDALVKEKPKTIVSRTDLNETVSWNDVLAKPKINGGKITATQAKSMVWNDCRLIRSKADFYVSTNCSFSVASVHNHGDGKKTIANFIVYSKGKLYDITFSVSYRLTWDENGKFTRRLVSVKEGRFADVSEAGAAWILMGAVIMGSSDGSSSSGSYRSSSSRSSECILCGDSGWMECGGCGGDGITGFIEDKICSSCGGRGTRRCYH